MEFVQCELFELSQIEKLQAENSILRGKLDHLRKSFHARQDVHLKMIEDLEHRVYALEHRKLLMDPKESVYIR